MKPTLLNTAWSSYTCVTLFPIRRPVWILPKRSLTGASGGPITRLRFWLLLDNKYGHRRSNCAFLIFVPIHGQNKPPSAIFDFLYFSIALKLEDRNRAGAFHLVDTYFFLKRKVCKQIRLTTTFHCHRYPFACKANRVRVELFARTSMLLSAVGYAQYPR